VLPRSFGYFLRLGMNDLFSGMFILCKMLPVYDARLTAKKLGPRESCHFAQAFAC
jgi:hypothetical protein